MARRFLVTGRGSIALRHVRHLREFLPALELAVVARGGTVDPAFGDCTRIASFEEGLQWQPDAVIIASVSSRHADELEACLLQGLPCLAEKPLVIERKQLERVRAASAVGVAVPAVVVGCNLRYLPALRRLAAELKETNLGVVARAHFEVGQDLAQWRPSRDLSSSYSAKVAQGGGVVFDLVHEIDMARWLLGPLGVRAALGARTGPLPIETDDVHVALLERSNGAPVIVSLDYVSQQAVRRYDVVCAGGTLTCDIRAARLTRTGRDGCHMLTDLPSDFDVPQTYRAQMQDWLAALCDPAHAVASPLGDALETASLMLAMNEAAS